MFTLGFLVNVLEDQPLEGEADGLTETINHPKFSSVLVGLRWSAFLWRKRLFLPAGTQHLLEEELPNFSLKNQIVNVSGGMVFDY